MTERQIERVEKYYNFLTELSNQIDVFSIVSLARFYNINPNVSFVLKNEGLIKSEIPFGHSLNGSFYPSIKLAKRIYTKTSIFSNNIKKDEDEKKELKSISYLEKALFAKNWLIKNKGKVETNSPIHEMIKEIGGSSRSFQKLYVKQLN